MPRHTPALSRLYTVAQRQAGGHGSACAFRAVVEVSGIMMRIARVSSIPANLPIGHRSQSDLESSGPTLSSINNIAPGLSLEDLFGIASATRKGKPTGYRRTAARSSTCGWTFPCVPPLNQTGTIIHDALTLA
ncbi:hypothetical protein FRC09_008002 [Ceratobasidium sp. 395]|nr:hypothetical protein FRC09_008002 [Ceratobasidium sp. 395]